MSLKIEHENIGYSKKLDWIDWIFASTKQHKKIDTKAESDSIGSFQGIP